MVAGSLNWTTSANDANSENAVIVLDTTLAQAYTGAFQGMCDGGWRMSRRYPIATA